MAIMTVVLRRRKRNSKQVKRRRKIHAATDHTASTNQLTAVGSQDQLTSAATYNAAPNANLTPQGTNVTLVNTNYSGNTTMVGGKEVAVPMFLEMEFNSEYCIDQLEPTIAEGGGGVILKGHFLDWKLGGQMLRDGIRDCVVKQVKATKTAAVSHAALLQEIALLYYLRGNDSIIRLLGFNMKDMVIVMPFFPMGSLNSVIVNDTKYPLWSFDTILQISIDVFTAIAVVHKAEVVHRDIKSQNYLVQLGG